MSLVFADTFYFLGLLNRADESHSRCAAFAREYRGGVVTTAYVLVEVADGLAKPQHRVQTAKFIQMGRQRIQESGRQGAALQPRQVGDRILNISD